MPNSDEEITVFLKRSRKGPAREEQDRLYRLVEAQLRVLARSLLRSDSGDHTLQPTVLVDEAFVRLMNGPEQEWEGRSHFFKIAYGTMKRILIDHGRRRRPEKIGDEAAARVADHRTAESDPLEDREAMTALSAALADLERSDPQAADTFLVSFFHRLQKQVGNTDALFASYSGENLPIREVAQQRGLTSSTAWRQLGKALEFLQDRLREKGLDE